MMVTKGISVQNFDLGTCTNDGCSGSSLFRLDRTTAGASWQFNWEGARGRVRAGRLRAGRGRAPLRSVQARLPGLEPAGGQPCLAV
jgi:hypothetical protein